eukprot:TRINITY_DN5311_c0_g1_i1.p1 TRINITY_DN5311_c0_g1~~TRINITY_DN5311_c0_g1_i1.p1  ORF type:complete len:482 (-),score=103.89 TRINITY_DN5311_c0_g1_i1:9-1454(-)
MYCPAVSILGLEQKYKEWLKSSDNPLHKAEFSFRTNLTATWMAPSNSSMVNSTHVDIENLSMDNVTSVVEMEISFSGFGVFDVSTPWYNAALVQQLGNHTTASIFTGSCLNRVQRIVAGFQPSITTRFFTKTAYTIHMASMSRTNMSASNDTHLKTKLDDSESTISQTDTTMQVILIGVLASPMLEFAPASAQLLSVVDDEDVTDCKVCNKQKSRSEHSPNDPVLYDPARVPHKSAPPDPCRCKPDKNSAAFFRMKQPRNGIVAGSLVNGPESAPPPSTANTALMQPERVTVHTMTVEDSDEDDTAVTADTIVQVVDIDMPNGMHAQEVIQHTDLQLDDVQVETTVRVRRVGQYAQEPVLIVTALDDEDEIQDLSGSDVSDVSDVSDGVDADAIQLQEDRDEATVVNSDITVDTVDRQLPGLDYRFQQVTTNLEMNSDALNGSLEHVMAALSVRQESSSCRPGTICVRRSSARAKLTITRH